MEETSSSSSPKYDVFISFRGEDTRVGFTSHLHSALLRADVNAFIDNYVQKGADVWPELSQAIKDSTMAIVVFSKNYASSRWCLEELLEILQCRKLNGQVVIPVFYEVDPSDIRKHKGTYGEFAKHELELLNENKDEEHVQMKVSEWKAALKAAANISGRDTNNRECQTEAQVIEKIVGDVEKSLELRTPNELKDLAIAGPVWVKFLLSKNKPENVRVVGIWGMGGIGKTTMAKAVFSEVFHQYDGICFLEKVREASQNIGQSKPTSLREKLLSELLKDQRPTSTTPTVKRKLCSKRIFVVLDDVDDEEQLDNLCELCRYAGPGSKLIITSRDQQLLSRQVDKHDIYEVHKWSRNESLKLFCLSAFNKMEPNEGYEGLTGRAIQYADGNPLALKVLGSNLRGRSTEFWDSELKKLKKYPNRRIENVFLVSYDGLDESEQKIFLDIAFFFKDERKDFVERILNACYGYPTASGLEVLKDKTLITISNKRIEMHDLIQNMGWNVVRRSNEDPGKRSRLRDIDEVSDVLQCKRKGTDAIEGIKLDLSQIGNLQLNPDAFSMMTVIRFLKLHVPFGETSGNMVYPEVLNEFSGKLRYLEWSGYRLTSLPETFCTEWLVEIHMPHSRLVELWPENKIVEQLERIDMSECKYLQKLPNLSKASKLKWVNLSGCESLDEIRPYVLSLDSLESLTLDGCKKLTSLESEKQSSSLKKISVNGCTSLKEFSVWSEVMESLDLNAARIEKFHSPIGHSSKLRRLNLEGLELKNLPDRLSLLKKLTELRISNCKLLALDEQNLHPLFDGLRSSLELLYLKDCCNLSKLPDNISCLSNLCELSLDRSTVETLPTSIKHLNMLEILSLTNCMNLKSLPELPIRIKEFHAANCISLETIITLKTFATVKVGKEQYISFENCMNLDIPSRQLIVDGAQLSAMSAIFQNVLVRSKNMNGYGRHNYDFVKVCSPGDTVPEQFPYRTKESSLTIYLPPDSGMLGLVLCAVLRPDDEITNHGARIICQCFDSEGTKMGNPTRWYNEPIRELTSDHVVMWYDAIHFDNIVRGSQQQVTFKFYVMDGQKMGKALNICTQECGLRLIFETELPNLLRELDLDFESKWELGEKLASELELPLGQELRLELESQVST